MKQSGSFGLKKYPSLLLEIAEGSLVLNALTWSLCGFATRLQINELNICGSEHHAL